MQNGLSAIERGGDGLLPVTIPYILYRYIPVRWGCVAVLVLASVSAFVTRQARVVSCCWTFS